MSCDSAPNAKHGRHINTALKNTCYSRQSCRRSTAWSMQATLLAIVVIVALSCLPGAYAFGAGNIPSFAYMEGKAFRHGDIEDILEELVKKSGSMLFGNSKFTGLDVARVYFGNWLRDYSQAMDVAALQKMSKQSILNIVMVLGFMAHGFATAEFQVTSERLGVYLPEEHLDNPKGYADGKDARQFDPRLREPVEPIELEIDPRSGMKNYLANESGHWRTGSALIRQTLKRVIELGREARQSGNQDQLFEAYRLLGQALHTLEDFPAHSNWCELALHRLGHRNVFLHVGDNVKLSAPDGTRVAPIVTGTFGSADFIHSLLGEAQDHLSEASISDLNRKIDDAKNQSSGNNRSPLQDLLGLMAKVPSGSSSNRENLGRDLEQVSHGPSSDPAEMSPQEMYKNLWKILELRDRIMKSITSTIEKIPGLNALVEKITNQLNIFVFTLIEPYVKPIMQQGMGALQTGSGAVINQEDQFEVFNDPNASDPTHSMLSKDHFGLILNEVAGNVAKIIVRHAVNLVVRAWDDGGLNPDQIADECLAPMFHPYWFNGRAEVQKQMLDYVAGWAQSHPTEIQRLDREHVRTHTNTRSGKAEPHTGCGGGGGGGYGGNNNNNNSNQGGGIGTQMAGATSGFISNQLQGMVGGGNTFGAIGGGLFREAGNDTLPARNYDNDEPRRYHGSVGHRFDGGGDNNQRSDRYSSGERPPTDYGRNEEYGTPHNRNNDDIDKDQRPTHDYGRTSGYSAGYGGGVGGGGGSTQMPDENRYVSQSSGHGSNNYGDGRYPHHGPPSHHDSGSGHSQPWNYQQASDNSSYAPPPGPPQMPMASTGIYGDQPMYGQPPRPPQPPYGGNDSSWGGNSGGGYGGNGGHGGSGY